MAERIDFSSFVTEGADGAREVSFVVEGVHCGGCIGRIERALAELPGVLGARLNFTNRRLTVAWRGETLTPADLVEKLEALGYRAFPFAGAAEDEEARHAKWLLRCLGVAGFATMNIMLLSVSVWSGNVSDITPEMRDFFHWLSALIAIPAAAYAGQPFFQSAWRALSGGGVNMDVPISLGVLLALGMSVVETALGSKHAYFDAAVMLLFFLLAGRYLDQAMRRKTRMVAGNLSALKAEIAHRLRDGALEAVPVSVLKPGEEVLVRPGERIPVDGTVLAGRSEIDDGLVTGETARRAVEPGAVVYGGSLNYDGALTLSVTAAGEGTLLAEVERLLAAAVERKSRYMRLADRAARLYAPVVHTAAALTAAGWLLAGAGAHFSIITAIAVLIITCPCALALAVPAVQVVATGRLFRGGVLVHAGDALERLAEVDTVVFDKTGTLTLPEPSVANVREIAPAAMQLAARLALASHHPLAKAVAREAADRRPVEGATEVPGQGVRATLDGEEMRLGSLAFCGVDAAPDDADGASLIAFRRGAETAVFRIAQRLRPDAAETVRALKARKLEILILSGDRRPAVEKIAGALGVASWQAGLNPAEKIRELERMKAAGRKVLMVGDGLNDAPALAAAHVSLSPITAADLTQAQADAVFLGERLRPVLDSVTVAARARQLMRQNLRLATIYNVIAIPLAVAGYVTPLIAALSMSASSIIVIANALRAGDGAGQRETREQRAAAAVPAGAQTVQP